MKKHLIFLSTFAALLLSATLLTACGEDVQESAANGNNGATITETKVGENCTLFSSGDDGTRTALDTNRNFYWSEGDQIYVNTDGANYKKTTSSKLSSNKRTADFVLEGVKLTAEKCSLMYIGNGMESTQQEVTKDELLVRIENRQTQSAWGNSAHIGRAGDCGVAEATKDKTTGKYSFNLRHKASYLIFQPYRPTGNANPDWKLMKIEIIARGTTKVAGEYSFGTGELVGTGSSNTIEFNCGTDGFPLEDTGGLPSAAKSCFAVIAPDYHALTIRYTVKVTKKPDILYFDKDGNIHDEDEIWVFDKPIPGRLYPANSVTIIQSQLSPPSPYYCWDAPIDQPYDYNLYKYNFNGVTAPDQASRSCKDMPNINEEYWYITNGDPRWDETTWWSNDGGVNEYTGGCWIMKKEAILAAGRTFDPNIGIDNYDMRVYRYQDRVYISTDTYKTGGRPADTSNYFFLPALGCKWGQTGQLDGIGGHGYYWSSSPYNTESSQYPAACNLHFGSTYIRVNNGARNFGTLAGSNWFK